MEERRKGRSERDGETERERWGRQEERIEEEKKEKNRKRGKRERNEGEEGMKGDKRKNKVR